MVETIKKEIKRANLLCQLILGMGCPDIYLTLSVRTETGKVRHNQGHCGMSLILQDTNRAIGLLTHIVP